MNPNKLSILVSRSLYVVLALCCLSAPAVAQGMQPLSDNALSSVRGRDGLSFDFSGFSMSGDARLTYYAPGSTASAYIGNPYVERSDYASAAQQFADPYRLDIIHGPIVNSLQLADIMTLDFPKNVNGEAKWQYVYDWGVTANSIVADGGSVQFKDVVFRGGGTQWSTPVSGDGAAFGLALRVDMANIFLRPGAHVGISPVESAGQMNLSGVHLAAADINGVLLNTPWVIADVANQPGVINATADADGNNPRLHVGIDWPVNGSSAPLGGLLIDKVSFGITSSDPGLGRVSIGTMQIQYLDIKFR